MLQKNEKEFLTNLVKEKLEEVKKDSPNASRDARPKFMAAEEEYVEFLEGLLKKLK